MPKKQTSYDKCKSEIVNSYMKKFERGKMKLANNKPITNRKQAIAVALSLSEKICANKINKTDMKDMEQKVHKMIYGTGKTILDTKLQLSNVKKALYLLNKYKPSAKKAKLERELLLRVIYAFGKGNCNKNVVNDLKKHYKH
jgi:hypothetical protein